MDRETIRHVLFEYLKTVEPRPNNQLSDIYSGVITLAVAQGHMTSSTPYGPGGANPDPEALPEADRLMLQELVWELILQGIITPGSNLANPNLPHYRITEYGVRCLQENTVLPHDYGTYLQTIKDVATDTDAIFLLYLEESVEAFNKGLYISSMVNLGVASERLIELLVDALEGAVATEANKTRFKNAIKKAHHIAYQFNEVFSRLVSNKAKLPNDIGQDLDMLKVLVDIVRRERNDGGHPTGRKFEREETLVLLIAFQPHYKFVIKVLDWLKANPDSL